MEGLELRIKKQEAAVKKLKLMVAFKQAPKSELDAAQAELAKLKASIPHKKQAKVVNTPAVNPIVVPTQEVLPQNTSIASELLKKIRLLQDESAELSNELHLVPEEENCIHITSQLIVLRERIEKFWTQYRHLEKYGSLPEEEREAVSEEKSAELLRLQDEEKKFMQERSKLKSKLKQPGNKESLRDKWNERLCVVNGIIDDLRIKMNALR